MGAVVSKAASGIVSVLGSAFVAPIKAIFGRSCEGICSGTWDLICFVEHLCIASLVRLFIVSVLTYIILLFFYLLFKVGIIQCIGRSFCKMTWAACEAYWTALEDISCFFWHKLKDTKRVYRGRFEDMEEEFSTTDTDPSEDYESIRVTNRRKSVRDKRKDRLRRSLYPKSHSSLKRRQRSGLRHHVRLKTHEVSVHVEGSRRRKKAGQIQVRSRAHHIGPKLFNRQ
ncbi:hypothetical protein IEQ34_019770 [Dendrobium chrysotoxum]|uniref:Uncharacterized protein n=1 Tax=Dendrobium chrysotoxum TaxID=161865 RepID=A0AAV7G7X6_DENCH|nr:hypothetical protein IEQ34_019770 [Dendrobium chrysotoxum]